MVEPGLDAQQLLHTLENRYGYLVPPKPRKRTAAQEERRAAVKALMAENVFD